MRHLLFLVQLIFSKSDLVPAPPLPAPAFTFQQFLSDHRLAPKLFVFQLSFAWKCVKPASVWEWSGGVTVPGLGSGHRTCFRCCPRYWSQHSVSPCHVWGRTWLFIPHCSTLIGRVSGAAVALCQFSGSASVRWMCWICWIETTEVTLPPHPWHTLHGHYSLLIHCSVIIYCHTLIIIMSLY